MMRTLRLLVVSLFIICALTGISAPASAQSLSYSDKLKAIAPANLQLYLPCTETVGTVLNDASGNSRHGTYSGVSLGATTGPVSGTVAPTWDGLNDYATIPHVGALMPTTQLTIQVWARQDVQISTYAGILWKSDGSWTSGGYGLYIVGGNLRAWTTGYTTNYVQMAVAEAGWTQWVFTTDGAAWTLYKNGAQVAQSTYSASITSNSEDVTLGYAAGGGYFAGSLAQIAVWDTALTAEQVASLAVTTGGSSGGETYEYITLESGQKAAIDYTVSAGSWLQALVGFIQAGLLMILILLTLAYRRAL